MKQLGYRYSDGGRFKSGFKGQTGDCGCRALAILTGRPYQDVYFDLAMFAKRHERPSARSKKRGGPSHPRTGYHSTTMRAYMKSIGWTWHPTMHIGQGCQVHLNADELPEGDLMVTVSKHFTAVKNGVIYDSHDPRRGGKRCVYGYFTPPHNTN